MFLGPHNHARPLSPRQSTVAHPLDLVESLYLDQGVEVEEVGATYSLLSTVVNRPLNLLLFDS